MLTVVSHPDNIEQIRKQLANKAYRVGQFEIVTTPSFGQFELVEDSKLAKDQPSGKFILPTGKAVTPNRVLVQSPFVDYGPEDTRFLMYAGLIRQEMEAMVYIVDTSRFDMFGRI